MKEIIPLDEFLLIDKLPFKMTKLAMLLCAEFAQLLPSYKTAEKIIGKHCGMKVSDTYTGRVTDYVGGQVYETDKERSLEAYEKMPYPGSAEGFKKFVRDVATRNHCFEYEKIVIVSDGAPRALATPASGMETRPPYPGSAPVAESPDTVGKSKKT
jgi:hypothetical protein